MTKKNSISVIDNKTTKISLLTPHMHENKNIKITWWETIKLLIINYSNLS